MAYNFKRWRKKYWVNHGLAMPENVTCVFRKIKNNRDTHNAGMLETLATKYKIYVAPETKYSYWAAHIVLLHEMAHLYLQYNFKGWASLSHGKLFQAEIDRLYALGVFRKLI